LSLQPQGTVIKPVSNVLPKNWMFHSSLGSAAIQRCLPRLHPAGSAGSGQTAVTARPTTIPIETSTKRCNATIHGGAECGMSITMASVMPAKR